MVTKQTTHRVRFPVMTDLTEFLGAYRLLFESIGLQAAIDFPPCETFQHPIEEEHNKLTEDYMETYQMVQNMWLHHGSSLRCSGVSIGRHFAIFVLEYDEIG